MVIQDGGGNLPDHADLEDWADEHGFDSTASLGVPDASWWMTYEVDAYIPSTWILDREMRVVSADAMSVDPRPWL